MRPIGSFDSVVLAAVAVDLDALTGQRLRRTTQPGELEIALEFRTRAALAILCSIHPRWARIHLATPPGDTRRSPFAQMVHSRLEGARLTAVQRIPFERVLTLHFETDAGGAELVAEIMGRHSNLILVQNGLVAGAFRVPPPQPAAREVRPGLPYRLPPAAHPSPAELSEDRLRAILAGSSEPLAERLNTAVLGISLTMAREITARADLDAAMPAREAAAGAASLLGVLRGLAEAIEHQEFAPVIYHDAAGVRGFAPFPLAHVRGPRMERVATMSEAVARVSAEWAATTDLEDTRARLLAAIRSALADVDRAEAEVRRALDEGAAGDEVRRRGELLLAYASQIAPGAAQATVPGHDGAPVTITLDPALTAVENARALFARYAKIRRARPALQSRLRQLDEERAYLESSLALAEQAATLLDLQELRGELAGEGYVRRPRRRPAVTTPPRRAFTLASGATVLVGRTNQDNDRITFGVAGPDDLWFHARGVPGAHVVLRTGGRAARDDEIAHAAAIAAYFSRGRTSHVVAVDYLPRRYVRKPKGARPGLVTYAQERTLRVPPRLP